MASIGDIERSDRAIRAYAYLTASFRVQNNVNDVLDCIVPFVSAVALKDVTKPISATDLAEALTAYGLKIPVYAVSQLLPRLARRGLLEWNAVANAFLPVAQAINKEVKEVDLSHVFISLESRIAVFAENYGMNSVPFSSSWGDALIHFLRSDKMQSSLKLVRHREAIVTDASDVETFIIARFIQNCRDHDLDTFKQISQVYTGALIEDFIGNVQTLGITANFRSLSIFYDTPVLLRLLGTSGDLLRTATLEMHSNLKDLGCNLYYLDVNRSEASNILETIVLAATNGHEIFGETAEAIYEGDTSIADIKDLIGTFETRLAQLNVFPFEYDYAARKGEDSFQIGENYFVEALMSAAARRDRGYKRENAEKDATALAIVLRLRKGRASRDIASSRFLFVSRNSLLQKSARKFAIEHTEDYDESSTPAILTLGQITVAGWLATASALEPHKVSQELLALCYGAVKPSATWAEEFARATDEFSAEDKTVIEQRADSILILNATREAARDESLNEAAILRKVNVAEKFRIAKLAADQAEADRQSELDQVHQSYGLEISAKVAAREAELRQEAALELQRATLDASQRGRHEYLETLTDRNTLRAEKWARQIVNFLQIASAVACILILTVEKYELFRNGTAISSLVLTLALIVSVLTLFDLLGFKPVVRFFAFLHIKLAAMFLSLLVG